MLKARVDSLIARLAKRELALHGFTLSIGGETKAIAYYAPFFEGQPHRMYSVSKSMLALALGLLMDDGLLSLSDRITDFFPDLLPAAPDGRLMRLTLRDMLRMATCHARTAYREGTDQDWTRPFFLVPPAHEPGTVFHYDTSASQVLAALVRRVSGRSALELLNERIFQPIGAVDEKRWLTDPSGELQGGTGLIMSLKDLQKTAQLMMDGGRGLISQGFLSAMTKKQIDTPLVLEPEGRYGYGYHCWRTRASWAMYGMGGQLAVCCPEKHALFCTVADTRLDPFGVQAIYDAFFEELYPYLDREDMPLTRYTLAVRALAPGAFRGIQQTPEYHFAHNALGLEHLSLSGQTLRWIAEERAGEITFGLGENARTTFLGEKGADALCSGCWLSDKVLRVRCELIGDAPCGVELLLCFNGARVTVDARRSSDPLTRGFEGTASGTLAE